LDLGLKGKRAFVAGSSRGLGYAAALLLSKEGCSVAINGRDNSRVKSAAETIFRESGNPVVGLAGDVSEQSTPGALIGEAVRAFGGLDLLVTNAGGPPAGAFESFEEVAWQKALDLSFMSHVRFIRAALPHLRDSDAASVLTMTSYTVKQPLPNLVLSNSIRLATIGLTKTLALELGEVGVRFNSILPATIDTDRVRELAAFRAKQNGT
jgi:3-oxoacyl-[acyl-carrier protein] reductase